MSTTAWRFGVTTVAAVLLGAGCQRAASPVATAVSGPRVVTLAPNLTELVCAVGAGDRLVGRTSVCNYPLEIVARVPVIGDFGVPSIERILALKPTVLLEADMADPATLARLQRSGIAVLHVPCVRLDDIPSAMLMIGQNVGRTREATALAADLRRKIAALRAAAGVSQSPRPRVYVEIWNDPLSTVGHNSFLAELVRMAGGDNL
ncbi:MAG: helical backbone metal receptor, partial [bacterium]